MKILASVLIAVAATLVVLAVDRKISDKNKDPNLKEREIRYFAGSV